MKKRELHNLGFAGKEILSLAVKLCSESRAANISKAQLKEDLLKLIEKPEYFLDDSFYGPLANLVVTQQSGDPLAPKSYDLNQELGYEHWGDDIDPEAHKQMQNACLLPISRRAALMPDAHLGYGLPIGGVLATKDAVIPYAVGVDIACRVMISVLDTSLTTFKKDRAHFKRAIEENTQFGIGAKWERKKEHAVLEEDWNITPITSKLKDLAWSQLGSSGSGNHFVEFGEITFEQPYQGLPAGCYLALVSHSGSRGAGARIAKHYSQLAMSRHPHLPKYLQHLAWLSMKDEGAEYWEAMQLMGKYASANHHIIHKEIRRHLRCKVLFQVENHHNFAWREIHHNEELIVHRKGATPAGQGVLGYIPGSMTAAGYLVEGRGADSSLHSCSHGAGRQLSRKKAKNSTTYHELNKILADNGVELLSAGLDESPHAYKDIDEVMAAQSELVKTIARFVPKLVKMAPDGERPED